MAGNRRAGPTPRSDISPQVQVVRLSKCNPGGLLDLTFTFLGGQGSHRHWTPFDIERKQGRLVGRQTPERISSGI